MTKVSYDLSALKNLHPVKVIRVHGDRKSAVLENGKIVYRKERLWMGKSYGIVQCCPYDNHFIFDDPDFETKVGRWTPMCTCGSPAIIVGAKAYAYGASPTTREESTHPGQMIVCNAHVHTGKHGDGSS